MKKTLSLFLSLVMLISVFSGLQIVANADTSEDGDWTYTISDDGTAVITAYNGSDTEITIPATVDGYTVTEVGFSSSSGSNSTITSITISEGITTLSTYAFRSYTALESVSLPSTLTAISNFAFQNCYVLTGVTIPEAVTSIGNYSFQNCYALTEIIIPAAVTSLGTSAFYSCTSLEYVLILSETATIGNTCFRYDGALTTLISVSSGSVTNSASTITSTSVVLYGLSGSYLNTLATSRSKTFVAIEYEYSDVTCTEDGGWSITVSEKASESVLTSLGLSVGDTVYSLVYEALGHDYVGVRTAENCTDDAYTVYTCQNDSSHTYTVVEEGTAYGHTFTSKVTRGATCTYEGVRQYTCETCGYQYEEAIEKTHNYSWSTTDGELIKACESCGTTSIILKYTDLQGCEKYGEYIAYMSYYNSYIHGTTSTTYGTWKNLTRAAAITILYRMAGSPSVSGSNPFSDVKKSDYYYKAALWAYKNGITTESTFRPTSKVTREELATLLYEICKGFHRR